MSTRTLSARKRAVAVNPKLLVRQADHRFYLGTGLFLTLFVFLGFWPTYFRPLLTSTYEGSMLLHIHAIVFLSWMGMFVTQSVLVMTRRTPLHKRVGLRGMVLGVLMCVLGLAVTALLIRRFVSAGMADSVATGALLAAEPVVDITQFAVLLLLGYLNRRDPQVHKRYMLLATIAIMPAATARMGYLIGPWSMELLFVVFAAMILLHDWRVHGRIYRANVIGLLILLPRALVAMAFKL